MHYVSANFARILERETITLHRELEETKTGRDTNSFARNKAIAEKIEAEAERDSLHHQLEGARQQIAMDTECIERIRRIGVEVELERDSAIADNAALREAGRYIMEATIGHDTTSVEYGDWQEKLMRARIKLSDAIASPYPGAPLLAELIRLREEHDKLVERSVGAMTIAEGEEDHEKIPRDCPMLIEVSNLREGFEKEKARRIYYQNIVYSCCITIDQHNASKLGAGIVCGTLDSPSVGLQDAVALLCTTLSTSESSSTPAAEQLTVILPP